MKLFEQINTYQQSRRLKELRLRVKGLFKWKWDHMLSAHKHQYMNNEYYPFLDMDLPAYTVSELGEMMKDLPDHSVSSQYNRYKKVWLCTLWKIDTYDESGLPDGYVIAYETFGFSEAEARCDMLFHLIAEDLLPVPQINRQMQLV